MNQRRQKYGNRKCEVSILPELRGRRFDSQLEASVACTLCARVRDGEISKLEFQHTVCLSRAHIKWKVDFSYIEDGQLWCHEAKGLATTDYMIKLKLYRVYGPVPLRISKGTHRRHRITDTIFPVDFLCDNDEGGSSNGDG